MTGKGTVGSSDAHMNNWPDGWDRGGAPAEPPSRRAQPADADEPTRPWRAPSRRLRRWPVRSSPPRCCGDRSSRPDRRAARISAPHHRQGVDVRRMSRNHLVAVAADGGCAAPCSFCW